MMWLALVLLPAVVEVDAKGCVDVDAVAAAIDGVGGVEDVAEDVHVRVDGDRLFIDVALVGAPPLHREAPLRPVECKDVADLVAFLVKSQRGQAKATGALPKPDTPSPFSSSSPSSSPALQPRRTQPQNIDAWSVCDGPPTCGGLRITASVGLELIKETRIALDLGYDVADHTTAVVTAVYGNAGRVLLSAGLQQRTMVAHLVELSARGGLGVGGAVKLDGVRPLLAPEVVGRARIGFVFVDVGGTWHLNIDDTPSVIVAVGVALSGG